jgi:hypothetical protein|tara:strand:+ start:271 stop:450 length:180 start_codon:yes stop_codon:yes gene_type:complete
MSSVGGQPMRALLILGGFLVAFVIGPLLIHMESRWSQGDGWKENRLELGPSPRTIRDDS